MAALEVLMEAMAGNREPTGMTAEIGSLGEVAAAQGRVLVVRRVLTAASVTVASGVLATSEDEGG